MMNCPNCGCYNLDGTEKCKNCEYPLIKINDIEVNPDDSKNSALIILFNIVYCFMIPIILFYFGTRLSDELLGIKSLMYVMAFLIHVFGESFSYLNTFKIVKNKENFFGSFSWYELIVLIFLLLLIVCMPSLVQSTSGMLILIIFTMFKLVSYVFTIKVFLKEKIRLKILPIILLIICYIMVFLVSNLSVPTELNKKLYMLFGNDFESKSLKIKLVNDYNYHKIKKKKISYLHKFNQKDLKQITRLEINKEINDVTIKDLSKLTNLERLSIKQLKIKYDFNLSFSKKLTVLKIDNVTFDNDFIVDTNCNIKEIYIENSAFKNIDIKSNNLIKLEAEKCKVNDVTIEDSNSLKEFYLIKSKINNVTINGNKNLRSLGLSKVNNINIKNMGNLETYFKLYKDDYGDSLYEYLMFKRLIFNDKKISFKNDEYIKFDGSLYVKKDSLVKDLLLENLTAKVFDYYHEVIRENEDGTKTYNSEIKVKEQGPDSGLGDKLYLYENNKEVLNCSVFSLNKYILED